MDYNKNMGKPRYLVYLLKGIGISILVTFAFMIILTLIMTYTNLSEGIILVVNPLIMVLAVAAGAIYISLRADTKGWLHGSIIGLLYVIFIVILSSIFKDFSIDKYVLLRLVVAIVTGAIGGMIGINLK